MPCTTLIKSLYATLAATTILAQSGTFSFLTYNVAGLPPIFNDNGVPGDKATNANLIGEQLGRGSYDIIHLQEDFNYHAYIYEADDHPYRTATSGGVPFGSGLNSLANYEWTELQRIKWDECNLNLGDCLTPKGFTFMRTNVGGLEIDLYNLHADAGDNAGDVNARSAGISQLLDFISANSQGHAVIVGGDTNDLWTTSGRSINKLTDAGFTDAWIEVIVGGQIPAEGSVANPCGNPAVTNECEVVDKVLFRSGDSVKLTAKSFNYVSSSFLQPDGNILSDHNPIMVEFFFSNAH